MVVTFYSFKGGVGRSMALANVGEILATNGFDVIVCDWDLEAPGLERYLAGDRRRAERYQKQPGIVDLLIEYRHVASTAAEEPDTEASSKGGDEDTFITIGKLRLRRPSSLAQEIHTSGYEGRLRLLTAGKRDPEAYGAYTDAVQTFDWREFYAEWGGGSYIEFFRQDLEDACDVVLIDSRTGVTEHGGVCTHHLPGLVVLFTAANDVNLSGTRWMAEVLSNSELLALRGDRPIDLLPVASRIEQTAEKEELVEFRARFRKEFANYLPEFLGDPDRVLFETEIPYMPYYSFAERVAARESEEHRERRLYDAYRMLTAYIVSWGQTRTQLAADRLAPAELCLSPLPAAAGRISTRPVKIWLSHRSEDKALVDRMVEMLERYAGGRVTFFRVDTAPAGTGWTEWARDKITQADMFIMFFLDPSKSWDWILYEAGLFMGLEDNRRHMIIVHPAQIEPPAPLKSYQSVALEPVWLRRFFTWFFGEPLTAGSSEPINSSFAKDAKAVETLAQEMMELWLPRRAEQSHFFVNRLSLRLEQSDQVRATIPHDTQVMLDPGAARLIGIRSQRISWQELERLNEQWGPRLARQLEAAVSDIMQGKVAPVLESFSSQYDGRSFRPIISSMHVESDGVRNIQVLLIEEISFEQLARLPSGLRVILSQLIHSARFYYEVLLPGVELLEELEVGGKPDLLNQWLQELVNFEQVKPQTASDDLDVLIRSLPPITRPDLRQLLEQWRTIRDSMFASAEQMNITALVVDIGTMRKLNESYLETLAEALVSVLSANHS